MTEATVSDPRILFGQLPKDIIARANEIPFERPTALKTKEEWVKWVEQAENAHLGTQKAQQQERLDRKAEIERLKLDIAKQTDKQELADRAKEKARAKATIPLPASPSAKPASAGPAPPPIVEEALVQPGPETDDQKSEPLCSSDALLPRI